MPDTTTIGGNGGKGTPLADSTDDADEVLPQLAGLVEARMRVTLEVEFEIPDGVPESVARTVTESSRTLGFMAHGFEEGSSRWIRIDLTYSVVGRENRSLNCGLSRMVGTMPEHRIYSTPFAKVYPMYVQKVERKGRTKAEVDRVIRWLTGYDAAGSRRQLKREIRYLDKLVDELARGKAMEKILR